MIADRTILIVDDEPQIRRVLRNLLIGKNAAVVEAESGEEALDLLRRQVVDVVLLDLNMPGMGGFKACEAIRAGWDIPIIVISVREAEADKIEALDAGADDYLTKPFMFDELMARIRAALRRSGFASDSAPARIETTTLVVDFPTRRVVAGGQHVRLTPTEFDLLRYLVTHANKPVAHKRILQAVWGTDASDQIEYLRVFINQLRKKIEPPGPRPTFITTEPRIGYRFVLPEAVASA